MSLWRATAKAFGEWFFVVSRTSTNVMAEVRAT